MNKFSFCEPVTATSVSPWHIRKFIRMCLVRERILKREMDIVNSDIQLSERSRKKMSRLLNKIKGVDENVKVL